MAHSESLRRYDFIDIAKGICIALVVFGHSLRGIEAAGLMAYKNSLFHVVDSAVYMFHMPVFFICAGLFYRIGENPKKTILKKGYELLLPLLVWSWIFGVFRYFTGGVSNSGSMSILEIFTFPFPPKGVYWFLLALFLSYALIAVVTSVRPYRPYYLIVIAALLFGASAILPYSTAQYTLHIPHFLLGFAASEFVLGKNGVALRRVATVLFLITVSLASVIDYVTVFAAIGFISGVGFVFLCKGLEGSLFSKPVMFLGRNTFFIYVSHVIFTAGMRVALMELGVENIYTHVLLGTLTGVAGPLVLLHIARRFGVSEMLMFDPPKLQRG